MLTEEFAAALEALEAVLIVIIEDAHEIAVTRGQRSSKLVVSVSPR